MKRYGAAVLALIALFALPAPDARAGEAERMLPDSTIFYVSLDDVSASSERLSTHPLKALWDEESMQQFMAPLLKAVEGQLESAREELAGASPLGLLEMTTGQLAFAFTGVGTGSSGIRPGVVLLAEIGENEDRARTWIAKMEDAMGEQDDARRVEEDFRGVTIVTWIPNEQEEGVEIRLSWCLSDGLFILSFDPEVLRMMLVRRGEEEESGLSATEDFRRVRERTEGTGDFFVYANLAAFWSVLPGFVEATTGSREEIETAMPILEALGLTDLRSFGIRASLTEDGMSQRWFLRMPGARRGLLRLFTVENGPLMPPAWVPPDVTQAGTMRLGIHAFWNEIRKIADTIQPGASKQLDAGLEQIKAEIGVDLEKDLIGSLGESMTVYAFPSNQPAEEDEFAIATPRYVYAFEVANMEKMRQSMDVIMALAGQSMGMPIEQQEYLGVRMDVIDMYPMTLGMSLVGGHMVIATDADDLRSMIRVQGKEDATSLSGTGGFARALAGMPRVRTMVSYSNVGKVMEEMLKEVGNLVSMFGEAPLGLDMSLLPVETLPKYFDVAGGVVVNEDDGLTMISRTLMKRPK